MKLFPHSQYQWRLLYSLFERHENPLLECLWVEGSQGIQSYLWLFCHKNPQIVFLIETKCNSWQTNKLKLALNFSVCFTVNNACLSRVFVSFGKTLGMLLFDLFPIIILTQISIGPPLLGVSQAFMVIHLHIKESKLGNFSSAFIIWMTRRGLWVVI